MKKLIVSLVLIGASSACTTTVISTPMPVAVGNGAAGGAPDAVSAVRGFLAAAKEPDLQTMGRLFGGTQGPAGESLPREELEKREVIMARCLRHDTYDIVGDAPNPGGGRNFVVNLNFHDLSRSSNFQVVMGPERRWYVQSFDPSALNDICSRRA
jgi:hypothetical protein